MAHGAELEFQGRPLPQLSIDGAYNYASTQILEAPFAFDPLVSAGQPLLRRPKHSGSLLLSYLGRRWGGNLGGSFVGRRLDSDFLGFGINHAAGYARVDIGGWFAFQSSLRVRVRFGRSAMLLVVVTALGQVGYLWRHGSSRLVSLILAARHDQFLDVLRIERLLVSEQMRNQRDPGEVLHGFHFHIGARQVFAISHDSVVRHE